MKRLLIALLLTLLMATGAYAGGDFWCKTSDEQIGTVAITTSPGIFHGIILATDASAAVTISIYDNATTAEGVELIPTTVITTSATDRVQSISISPGVRFYNGIYVVIDVGQGAVAYNVYYKNEND